MSFLTISINSQCIPKYNINNCYINYEQASNYYNVNCNYKTEDCPEKLFTIIPRKHKARNKSRITQSLALSNKINSSSQTENYPENLFQIPLKRKKRRKCIGKRDTIEETVIPTQQIEETQNGKGTIQSLNLATEIETPLSARTALLQHIDRHNNLLYNYHRSPGFLSAEYISDTCPQNISKSQSQLYEHISMASLKSVKHILKARPELGKYVCRMCPKAKRIYRKGPELPEYILRAHQQSPKYISKSHNLLAERLQPVKYKSKTCPQTPQNISQAPPQLSKYILKIPRQSTKKNISILSSHESPSRPSPTHTFHAPSELVQHMFKSPKKSPKPIRGAPSRSDNYIFKTPTKSPKNISAALPPQQIPLEETKQRLDALSPEYISKIHGQLIKKNIPQVSSHVFRGSPPSPEHISGALPESDPHIFKVSTKLPKHIIGAPSGLDQDIFKIRKKSYKHLSGTPLVSLKNIPPQPTQYRSEAPPLSPKYTISQRNGQSTKKNRWRKYSSHKSESNPQSFEPISGGPPHSEKHIFKVQTKLPKLISGAQSGSNKDILKTKKKSYKHISRTLPSSPNRIPQQPNQHRSEAPPLSPKNISEIHVQSTKTKIPGRNWPSPEHISGRAPNSDKHIFKVQTKLPKLISEAHSGSDKDIFRTNKKSSKHIPETLLPSPKRIPQQPTKHRLEALPLTPENLHMNREVSSHELGGNRLALKHISGGPSVSDKHIFKVPTKLRKRIFGVPSGSDKDMFKIKKKSSKHISGTTPSSPKRIHAQPTQYRSEAPSLSPLYISEIHGPSTKKNISLVSSHELGENRPSPAHISEGPPNSDKNIFKVSTKLSKRISGATSGSDKDILKTMKEPSKKVSETPPGSDKDIFKIKKKSSKHISGTSPKHIPPQPTQHRLEAPPLSPDYISEIHGQSPKKKLSLVSSHEWAENRPSPAHISERPPDSDKHIFKLSTKLPKSILGAPSDSDKDILKTMKEPSKKVSETPPGSDKDIFKIKKKSSKHISGTSSKHIPPQPTQHRSEAPPLSPDYISEIHGQSPKKKLSLVSSHEWGENRPSSVHISERPPDSDKHIFKVSTKLPKSILGAPSDSDKDILKTMKESSKDVMETQSSSSQHIPQKPIQHRSKAPPLSPQYVSEIHRQSTKKKKTLGSTYELGENRPSPAHISERPTDSDKHIVKVSTKLPKRILGSPSGSDKDILKRMKESSKDVMETQSSSPQHIPRTPTQHISEAPPLSHQFVSEKNRQSTKQKITLGSTYALGENRPSPAHISERPQDSDKHIFKVSPKLPKSISEASLGSNKNILKTKSKKSSQYVLETPPSSPKPIPPQPIQHRSQAPPLSPEYISEIHGQSTNKKLSLVSSNESGENRLSPAHISERPPDRDKHVPTKLLKPILGAPSGSDKDIVKTMKESSKDVTETQSSSPQHIPQKPTQHRSEAPTLSPEYVSEKNRQSTKKKKTLGSTYELGENRPSPAHISERPTDSDKHIVKVSTKLPKHILGSPSGSDKDILKTMKESSKDVMETQSSSPQHIPQKPTQHRSEAPTLSPEYVSEKNRQSTKKKVTLGSTYELGENRPSPAHISERRPNSDKHISKVSTKLPKGISEPPSGSDKDILKTVKQSSKHVSGTLPSSPKDIRPQPTQHRSEPHPLSAENIAEIHGQSTKPKILRVSSHESGANRPSLKLISEKPQGSEKYIFKAATQPPDNISNIPLQQRKYKSIVPPQSLTDIKSAKDILKAPPQSSTYFPKTQPQSSIPGASKKLTENISVTNADTQGLGPSNISSSESYVPLVSTLNFFSSFEATHIPRSLIPTKHQKEEVASTRSRLSTEKELDTAMATPVPKKNLDDTASPSIVLQTSSSSGPKLSLIAPFKKTGEKINKLLGYNSPSTKLHWLNEKRIKSSAEISSPSKVRLHNLKDYTSISTRLHWLKEKPIKSRAKIFLPTKVPLKVTSTGIVNGPVKNRLHWKENESRIRRL